MRIINRVMVASGSLPCFPPSLSLSLSLRGYVFYMCACTCAAIGQVDRILRGPSWRSSPRSSPRTAPVFRISLGPRSRGRAEWRQDLRERERERERERKRESSLYLSPLEVADRTDIRYRPASDVSMHKRFINIDLIIDL